MAEPCLSYPNTSQVKALSARRLPSLSEVLSPGYSLHSGTPFLEHPSLYWGIHAKGDLSGCAKQLVLELFNDYSNRIFTVILLDAEEGGPRNIYFDRPSLSSNLHYVSLLGTVEIVASFVEVESCSISQTDHTGRTPIMWAPLKGSKGVVKILVGGPVLTPAGWITTAEHPSCVPPGMGRGSYGSTTCARQSQP